MRSIFVNKNAQRMIYHTVKITPSKQLSKKFCLEYVYMNILKKEIKKFQFFVFRALTV